MKIEIDDKFFDKNSVKAILGKVGGRDMLICWLKMLFIANQNGNDLEDYDYANFENIASLINESTQLVKATLVELNELDEIRLSPIRFVMLEGQ